MIGTTVGKYRFVEKLGAGGMGTVYRAVDETLERQVAIKVLNAGLEGDALQRFRSEAVTLARLNHPRIAHLYELAGDNDRLLMVMELVGGQTLEQLIATGGAMPVVQAVGLIDQALDAIAYAHANGVVHRDLKPANIMIASGDAKVMDFGIARVTGSAHLTRSGYMMGTPAYMAPEQIRGEAVDGRADLYAMGVVLYRLLAGSLPFEAENSVVMIQKQLHEQPQPLRERRPDLPEWLERVVMRALAKSPDERFQSANEFRGLLATGLAEARDTEVHPAVFTDTVQTAAHHVNATAETRPSTVTLKRSHVAGGAGIVAALVAAVVLLAFVVLRRQTPPADVSTAPTSTTVASNQELPPPTSTPSPAPAPAQAPAAAPPPAPQPVQPAPVADAPAAASTQTRTATASSGRPAPPAPAPPSPVPPPAPAAAPAASTSTLPASGFARGFASNGSAPSTPLRSVGVPPPAAATPNRRTAADDEAVSFRDVRIVYESEGRPKEADVVLVFEGGRLTAQPKDKDAPRNKSFAYRSIVGATYSQSRHPRWKEGAGVAVLAGVFATPVFFMKSVRHWLTLQTADDFMVLRLDKDNVRVVLPVLETRAGLTVDRVTGEK